MLVRLMNEEDIDQVCRIEMELFSQPWRSEDFLSMMFHEDNIFLVVELEGRVIAYCGLMGIIDEGHISNVAVSKEHQHKGVAYKMLRELIALGRKRDLISFTLEVRIGNKKAIDLYKRLGFRNSGIRPNFYLYPKEDALIMWL